MKKNMVVLNTSINNTFSQDRYIYEEEAKSEL